MLMERDGLAHSAHQLHEPRGRTATNPWNERATPAGLWLSSVLASFGHAPRFPQWLAVHRGSQHILNERGGTGTMLVRRYVMR